MKKLFAVLAAALLGTGAIAQAADDCCDDPKCCERDCQDCPGHKREA
jgi:hypothetical protein